MNRYIEQLIETFAIAEAHPISGKDLTQTYEEFLKQIQAIDQGQTVSAESLFGVSYEELPPVEMLDKIQIQNVLIAILNAMSAKGINVHIPGNGVPGKIVYVEIREMFKEGFRAMPGWTIDFCSGCCPECAFAEYCQTCLESWSKEDMEKERNKIDNSN